MQYRRILAHNLSLLAIRILLIVAIATTVPSSAERMGSQYTGDAVRSVPKYQGMCYGPHRDNENPDAGVQPTLEELSEDIELISHLTTSIRTYGATDGLEQIPELCQLNGIDCYAGAWLSRYPCENKRQIDGLIEIARAGYSHLKGLIVGNEVLLRHDMSEDELIRFINQVKDSTDLPVATAEIWADWINHPELAEAVDIIFVHVYGFWDGVDVDSAVAYARERWAEVQALYPGKQVIIGETGWPSDGHPQDSAIPSEENQRQYFTEFMAMADSHNIDYLYFEIFDEKWKSRQSEGSVGSHWGLYESNGQLKPHLADLIPEAARAGIDRPRREVSSTPASLPLYIYTDACDSQNAFHPSGWMGALEEYGENDSSFSDHRDIIDIACRDNPYSGETCIRIIYETPGLGEWGGIYWQFPVNNWGAYPGYDLSQSVSENAYVKLRFRARGQNGWEQAIFKSGGIKGLEYQDSYGPTDHDYKILRDYWQQYELDLTGADLSMVIGGFAWVSPSYMFHGADTIYLDDIVILEVPERGTLKQGDILGEIWTASGSPYLVVGDIWAWALLIEPGVTVSFMGDYGFNILGTFVVVGTQQDSVHFTKPDSVQGWQGIYGNESIYLRYCSITGSSNSGIRVSGGTADLQHCLIASNSGSRGGGIEAVDMRSVTLDSCDVFNNATTGIDAKGGGVYIDADTVRLTHCNISGNMVVIEEHESHGGGGGIYVNGNTEITRCTISGNSVSCAESQSLWNSATFVVGGGVFAVGNLRIRGSEIRGNYVESPAFAPELDSTLAHSRGAGICAYGDSTDIRNSIVSYNDLLPFVDNAVSGGSAGIYVQSIVANIENCTIAYNGGGVHSAGNSVRVINSILWDNRLYQMTGNANVTYCDVDNEYPGIGNINMDPMFVSLEQLRISSASPCVDAGHYSLDYNDACQPPALGCLWNDMGAHGGPGSCVWDGVHVDEDTGACQLLRRYTLSQNYPNPFNSSTKIRFNLPKQECVKLTIWNILGQHVTTLIDKDLLPGEHVTEWNGTNSRGKAVASGVYLYRLETDGLTQARKMVLLK